MIIGTVLCSCTVLYTTTVHYHKHTYANMC